MAFIPKPNTGTLWPNNKSTPNHPDLRGDLHLDVDLLRKLIRETGDSGMIRISVAGWKKNIANKDCISMAASEPYVKKEVVVDEDVPF
jgi:hypothetical protein